MTEVALRAEFELFPTEQSGRRNGIRSGYRPALWFGGTDPHGDPDLHSCVVRLRNRDEVQPGEKVRADILPLALGTWPRVHPGTRFGVIDGTRVVGGGELVKAIESLSTEDLRDALHETLEAWIADRFGKGVAHRQPEGRRLQPDFRLHFRDQSERERLLVGEVVARGPQKRDVERIARLMEGQNAELGVIVGLDQPTRGAEGAAYEQGSFELGPGRWIPRIRMLSARDLSRWDPQLVPGASESGTLELIER